jgi:flagellar biosynthesis/type III secretory pathway protein FliH
VFSAPRDVPVFSRLDWDVRPMGEFGLLEIPLALQAPRLDTQDAPGAEVSTALPTGPSTIDAQADAHAAPQAAAQVAAAQVAAAETTAAIETPQILATISERDAVSRSEAQAHEAQAYERGFNEGRAAGLLAAQEEAISEQVQVLGPLLASLQAWRDAPEQVHAPLYRLALRLAQALVRCELSLSSQAIHRLVQGAIDALAPVGPSVVVTLNPDDWVVLQAALADQDLPWRVETDPALSRGSVRVSADDALVEDLLEDRLEALSSELFKPTHVT